MGTQRCADPSRAIFSVGLFIASLTAAGAAGWGAAFIGASAGGWYREYGILPYAWHAQGNQGADYAGLSTGLVLGRCSVPAIAFVAGLGPLLLLLAVVVRAASRAMRRLATRQ